jgi:Zn-dependent M28 family amino/carboxypeptidase
VDLAREVAAGLDIHIAEEDVRPGFRSDHLSFLDAGIPAIWFTTPPYDFIDSPHDTLDHVQPEVLEDVFSVALLFLRQFGGY